MSFLSILSTHPAGALDHHFGREISCSGESSPTSQNCPVEYLPLFMIV